MNRNELANPLRQEYDPVRGFGVAKVHRAGYENVWFVVPPPPPLKAPEDLPLEVMARAGAVLARLPVVEEMTEFDKLINFFFLRNEAVVSSRLEGTWSTLDDLLSPVEDSAAEGKKEELSVRGYARSLEKHTRRALVEREGIFSERLVREIHEEIVSKDPGFSGSPGALRAPGKPHDIVFIGGSGRKEDSVYNPAPPEFVRASLKKVLDWLSDKDLAQRGDAGVAGFTLPARLAIGHAAFEAVHPFSDGNGRVGRALWPIQMICSGRMPLYLSGFVEAEKRRYIDALQRAQKKLDYAPIVGFVCDAIVAGEAEAKVTRTAIEGLPKKWMARARFRGGSASQRALQVLLRKPIVTTGVLMEELKVSRQAANVAMDQLVERGIVRLRRRAGRQRVFAAEELVALLSRSFGTDVEDALAAGRQKLRKTS